MKATHFALNVWALSFGKTVKDIIATLSHDENTIIFMHEENTFLWLSYYIEVIWFVNKMQGKVR